MTWKIALPALLTLAAALVGCGGDPCTSAADRLATCAPPGAAASSSSGGMTPQCDGAFLCKSQCTNQFTCTQISGNDPAYTRCITQCNGK
jgi:hypothetical protein